MDPALLQLWWVIPTAAGAVGASVAGWWGVRKAGAWHRIRSARRLELDAARQRYVTARTARSRAKADVTAAKAELAHVEAEREARRASRADVEAARRAITAANQRSRAAASAQRAARARISAARAHLRDPRAESPLARVNADRERLEQRWLEYETDPARQIAYPAMTDATVPETAAYLDAQQRASWLRPDGSRRVTPTEFAAYTQAVHEMERTFDIAEREAKRRAGDTRGARNGPSSAPGPVGWATAAHDALLWSGEAVERASEHVARLSEGWRRTRERRRDDEGPGDGNDAGGGNDPDGNDAGGNRHR